MSARIVEIGTVVTLLYVLRDDRGQELGCTDPDRPHIYLQGFPGAPAGLQRRLLGRTAGERLQLTVPPEEGYGVHEAAGVQRLARRLVPEGTPLTVGQHLVVNAPDGRDHVVWITAIDEHAVTIDFNHPLAGVTLVFDVEIVDVRPATADEIAARRPLPG